MGCTCSLPFILLCYMASEKAADSTERHRDSLILRLADRADLGISSKGVRIGHHLKPGL